MNEEKVEKFINKLMEHISTKAKEIADENKECDSSFFGCASINTEIELANSIREIFEIPIEEGDDHI